MNFRQFPNNAIKIVTALIAALALPLAALGAEPVTLEPATSKATDLPRVEMHKNPGCGCCDIWAEHLRDHGFSVDVSEDPEIFALKAERNIPRPLHSCHTALIGDYFVEGHVPASDIMTLLKMKPQGVTGIAVPGMPLGSPGMEHPRPQDFNTIALLSDGNAYVFNKHKAGEDFSHSE
jgi:hypothetical protein